MLAVLLAAALAADPVADAPPRPLGAKRTYAVVLDPGRVRIGSWTVVLSPGEHGRGVTVDHRLRLRLGADERSVACVDQLSDDLTVLGTDCEEHTPRGPVVTRSTRVKGRKLTVRITEEEPAPEETFRVAPPVRYGVADALLVAERLGPGGALSVPFGSRAWDFEVTPSGQDPWSTAALVRAPAGEACRDVAGGTSWRVDALGLELCQDPGGEVVELVLPANRLRLVLCRDAACTIPSGRSAEEAAVVEDVGHLLRQLGGTPDTVEDLVDVPAAARADTLARARRITALDPAEVERMLPAVLGLLVVRLDGDTARVGVTSGRELVLHRRDGHWRLVDAVEPAPTP